MRARFAVAVHGPLADELRVLAPALVATLGALAAGLAVAAAADPALRLAVAPAVLLPAVLLGWHRGLTAAERQMIGARVALRLHLR